MDSGTGFSPVVGGSTPFLLTSHSITTGITQGGSYTFRVSAKNIEGFSPVSSTATIVAAASPDMMSAPLITVDRTAPSNKNAKISWAAPNDNGDTITDYLVEIRDKNGNFKTSASCDASNGQTAFTNMYCEIPMTELLGTDFNLVKDDLIQA